MTTSVKVAIDRIHFVRYSAMYVLLCACMGMAIYIFTVLFFPVHATKNVIGPNESVMVNGILGCQTLEQQTLHICSCSNCSLGRPNSFN